MAGLKRGRRAGKVRAGRAGSLEVSGRATSGKAALEQAFRCQVEPEIEVLLRVAYTLTGSWPDAEDVVQETLIRAWRALDRFDGAHPRAWLLTILRHAHLNSLRRQRPDVVADVAATPGAWPAFGAPAEPSPEERVIEVTFGAEVERALAALDPRFRTVLLLVDVDQLSYAEVAEVLGVPLGTVMSRLSRARDRVRRQLRTQAVRRGRS
jgi:RNA polymerase sigma-70 factor (ECF subfamily)